MINTINLFKKAFLVYYLIRFLSGAYAFKLPPSFSSTPTNTFISNPSRHEIINALKRFEVDSHLDIVLIGNYFSETTVRRLYSALDHLTRVGIKGSPSPYLHEKNIYHISLGRVLEVPVESLLIKNIINPENIDRLLASHHSRSSTTTTIFIISTKSNTKSSNSSIYSYNDKHFNCPQRAFLSSQGFAWIDLNSQGHDLWPAIRGNNILTVPDLSQFSDAKDLEELAYLIHRSAEALVPFPYYHDKNIKQTFNRPPRRINIILITICSDAPGIDCVTDTNAIGIAENMIRLYSNSYIQIGYTTAVFSVNDHPQLAHAVHASGRYTVPTNNQRKLITIDSKELVYWLSLSADIRKVILHASTRDSSPANERLLVPFITLHLPKVFEAMFEDGSLVHTAPLPSRPFTTPVASLNKDGRSNNGNDNDDVDRNSVTTKWPKNVVIYLRSGADKLVTTGLVCGPEGSGDVRGTSLETNQAYIAHKAWLALRQAIWNIKAPYSYYSNTARQVVDDYLWYHPQVLVHKDQRSKDKNKDVEVDSTISFREKRVVERLVFISLAEELLARVHRTIRVTSNVLMALPSMNMSQIFGYDNSDNNKLGSKDKTSILSSPFSDSKNKMTPRDKGQKSSTSTSSSPSHMSSLLEIFLHHMDLAGREMSHLDFDAAIVHLHNADQKVIQIEEAIQILSAERTGIISCDFKTTDFMASDTTTEKDISSFSASGTGFLLILIAVVVGSGFGWLFGEYSPKHVHKPVLHSSVRR